MFACPFCRVRSVLTAQDYFRYVLPAKAPASRELVYAPYWRFRGFLLFSRAGGEDYKYIDVNQLGADMGTLPPSLGLRAQAMKLKFAAPDMEGRFLPPSRSFTETFAAFQQRFIRGMGSGALASAARFEKSASPGLGVKGATRLIDISVDPETSVAPRLAPRAAASPR